MADHETTVGDLVQNFLRLMGSGMCERHRDECLTLSAAEFTERELARGCSACSATERDRALYLLKNLLAVMHRDGGHHTEEVGLEQSTKDAARVYYAMRTDADEAASLRVEIRKLKGAES